jgi:hypothetical protein
MTDFPLQEKRNCALKTMSSGLSGNNRFITEIAGTRVMFDRPEETPALQAARGRKGRGRLWLVTALTSSKLPQSWMSDALSLQRQRTTPPFDHTWVDDHDVLASASRLQHWSTRRAESPNIPHRGLSK